MYETISQSIRPIADEICQLAQHNSGEKLIEHFGGKSFEFAESADMAMILKGFEVMITYF